MIDNLKIERPLYIDGIVKYNASMEDTLKLVAKISSRDKAQVLELAQSLQKDTVKNTSLSIWNFLKENIPYKQDTLGTEQVRTPARLIEDAKNGIGSDCDCMTTFVSAILKNLDIDHYYKVVAWESDNYAHIYPVAIDEKGKEYAIDGIPEIKLFNVELPYTSVRKFSKHYNMDLQELNGAMQEIEAQEMEQDFISTELNGTHIEDESDEALDQYYVDNYQALMGNAIIVDSQNEADMILSGAEFFEGIYYKQLQLLLSNLKAEKKNPTLLSKYQDTDKEIAIAEALLSNWDSKNLVNYISAATEDSRTNKGFYKALKEGIADYTRNQSLNGVEDFDIYLRMLDDNELNGMALNGGLDGWFKKAWSKVKTGVKKVSKKVGNGLKKVGKALHRGAMLPMRATLFPLLRAGGGVLFLARYASKEDLKNSVNLQIKKKRADLIVDKLVKALGYKTAGFDDLVKKGIATTFGSVDKAIGKLKSGKQLFGVEDELNGELGWVAAVAGVVVKMWGFIKKVFKGNPKDPKLSPSDFNTGSTSKTPSQEQTDLDYNTESQETTALDYNMETQNNGNGTPSTKSFSPAKPLNPIQKKDDEKKSFGDKIKDFGKEHKKKIIIIGIIIGLLVIAFIGYKIWKKKQKPKSAPKRKKSNRSLNGSKIITTRTTVKTKDTGSRLKKMHRIAKQMQKQHPNTKYATLLKRAASQMKKAA